MTMLKQKITVIFIFVQALFFFACSSSVRFSSHRDTQTNTETESTREFENPGTLETVTGVASFYADKYHNKITYSGEVYDMNGISAAHPTYPMGTVIRITRISSGKSIVLTINDKMPQRDDRIIDLSLGAARELEMVQDGLAEVKVEVLKWGEGRK